MLKDALNDTKVIEKLNEVLEKEKTTINIYREGKEDLIRVEEKKEELTIENIVPKVKENRTITITKVLKAMYRIFEGFVDSIAKNFLKKKYKINNSVYNDGKKAVAALVGKDTKTFWKKATDSILNFLKKIPSDARKIIKNTKNIAIDEIYSWNTK